MKIISSSSSLSLRESSITKFLLESFFPKYCLSCKKEGNYLCQDCETFLDISQFHQKQKLDYLSDLYFSCSYENALLKHLIHNFKYEPFVKELAEPLALLILEHFQLSGKEPLFNGFILIPVPLEKKRLKWRGFNQSEEIARILGRHWQVPLLNNILFKTKTTPPQMELTKEEREENVKNAFQVENNVSIKNKKILLVDDIYTTGSTLKECAKVLKTAGAKEITGLVIARAEPV